MGDSSILRSRFHRFVSQLRALVPGARADAGIEEEVAAHIELQTRKHIQAGMSAEEARRRARLDFGGIENAKEECRDARRTRWLFDVVQDLRYAVRGFLHARGFTALIISMLGLGIGANLAIFSVTDAILLRMLPVEDPASLFRTVNASGNPYDLGGGVSYPVYRKMQKRAEGLADLMAYQGAAPTSISIDKSEPERLMQQTISGNYFEVLGIQAEAGRMISPHDDSEAGRHAVAVISYRLWQTRFGKAKGAIGTKLQFDSHMFEIVGVTPPWFFGVEVGKMVDVWTPVSMAPADNLTPRIMGRLHAGVTIAQAAAPLQAVMNEIMLEDVRQHAPPGTPKQLIDRFLAGMRIKGVPAGGGISYLRREYRQPLLIIVVVVGLVLLIACSSVANLLIARGSVRQQEIAIRLSLGAHRRRILQQLITESVLLAFLAASLGLLLARLGTPLLVRLLAPSNQPARLATGIDLRLLVFTSLLSLLTVLVSGLIPAFRLARTDMHATLKSGARLTGSGSEWVRRALVGAQIALSLVLVTGAILFSRTLVNLMSSRLGFDPSSVFVARIASNPAVYKDLVPAWNELLRRVRALAGVEQASLSSGGLFTGEPPLVGIRTTAAKPLPPDPTTGRLFVSPDYFQTLSIRFLAGHDFGSRDTQPDAPRRVIVNEAFVRKFFGNENPLGRRLTQLANAPVWNEIAGIVKDAKYGNLREAAPPMIYIPYGKITDWLPQRAHPGESMFLQLRGRESMASLAADLRREAGPRFTIGEMSRQQQLIDDTLVRERLLASIASLFGGLALLLATLGLYGIMSYSVLQRRREIGIRMAIGAAPKTIIEFLLRGALAIVAAGTAAGLVAASAGTHLAKALIFGFAANDPMTFIAAVILLLTVSLAAVLVPAYRASKIDPMIALRQD